MRKIFKQIPFARQTYRYFQELEYERKFARDCYGCFWGVYQTFEEAIRSAPKTKSIGYDNTELAKEYQQVIELETIAHSYNYPILFWLNSIFNNHQNSLNIFDFGGNVGIHFYTYKHYLKYPSNLNWIVCELPAIIKAGKQIAEQRGCSNLISFTDKFEDANKKDIFLASGSIQYVEDLSASLASLAEKPQHLLLNILPLYDGDKFVTLQNGGKVFYPSYVFNKASFIEGMNQIGYEMIDIWRDSYSLFTIPLHPEKSGSFFHGIYFKLKF